MGKKITKEMVSRVDEIHTNLNTLIREAIDECDGVPGDVLDSMARLHSSLNVWKKGKIKGEIMNLEDIKRFDYVEATEDHIYKYVAIKNVMQTAEKVIEENCKSGRERALALTKLEEVSMWACKAISRN